MAELIMYATPIILTNASAVKMACKELGIRQGLLFYARNGAGGVFMLLGNNKEPDTYLEVNIHGKINSELDEIDLKNKIIYENKSAKKLYMENPDYPQSEQQWAKKHILGKGPIELMLYYRRNLGYQVK